MRYFLQKDPLQYYISQYYAVADTALTLSLKVRAFQRFNRFSMLLHYNHIRVHVFNALAELHSTLRPLQEPEDNLQWLYLSVASSLHAHMPRLAREVRTWISENGEMQAVLLDPPAESTKRAEKSQRPQPGR